MVFPQPESFSSVLRGRQESARLSVQQRASAALSTFPSVEAVRAQLSSSDVALFDRVTAAARNGELRRASDLASRASTPVVHGQMRMGLDVIVFDKVSAAAQRGEFRRATELTNYASGRQSQMQMRVGMDSLIFDSVLAAAQRGEFRRATEMTNYSSSQQVQREMRVGLDVEVFDRVVASANQGGFQRAIKLTSYSSSQQVQDEMRVGLDAIVLDRVLVSGQRGDLRQAINFTGYASSQQAQRQMRADLDPVVLDKALNAAQQGDARRARDLTNYASSRTSQAEMLSQLGDNSSLGPRSTASRPSVRRAATAKISAPPAIDITDANARVSVLMATASPAHRNVFAQYSHKTIVALDAFLEDLELKSMASGTQPSSQTLTDGAARILGENGYETNTQDATRLVYALESVRADLGSQALDNPGFQL